MEESSFHTVFPITLEYKDKDGTNKVCYFQCEEHLEKYLTRYKLKKKDVKIEPTIPKSN